MQKAKSQMQKAKCKMQNGKCKIQNAIAKSQMQNENGKVLLKVMFLLSFDVYLFISVNFKYF